jgi:GT2 family glycosyltransferase
VEWPNWSFLDEELPKPIWAGFDPEWYVKRFAPKTAVENALAYYLAEGATLGHSPNPFFDENWYVSNHPGVAAAIKERQVSSGFEHYCRFGLHRLSPHWLYDLDYYRNVCGNHDQEGLIERGFLNLYDYYLKVGDKEGQSAHPLFSADICRQHLKSNAAQLGPFGGFLYWIEAHSRDIPVSIYFDHEWYLLTYPDVDSLIGKGQYRCALHHYLTNDSPTDFDPLSDFSERHYLQRYPEVEAAIDAGRFRNGYIHFLRHGAQELRDPAPHIDMRYYWSRSSTVGLGAAPPTTSTPFAHLLTIGAMKGLRVAPPPSSSCDVSEDISQKLFLARAQNWAPLWAARPIDFRVTAIPTLSVIMILHNHLEMSLMALASLRQNYSDDIELVLVDSSSTDETTHIERFVKGATVLRFDTDVGFVRGCNAALAHVTAPYVLFLDNDVQLAPGAIAAAMERIQTHPHNVGAVGGKIIRTNEKLQEAGCIVWRDGTTVGYLRDQSPSAPEANFVRDVDFCSRVFLLVRGDLIGNLDGFDPAFGPASYADTDLCLRIWQMGYRVVYEPRAVVYHSEHDSARRANAATVQSRRNHKIFLRKHSGTLRDHSPSSRDALPVARFATSSSPRQKVLFIEDTVPLRMLGSGFVRSNDIIRTMVSLGYQVTVFPMNGSSASEALTYGDFPDEVEIMMDSTHHDLQKFFEERPGYFDYIWICRAHNFEKARPFLSQTRLVPASTKIILDTEAIFSAREAVRAEMEGRTFDLERAIAKEFEHAGLCHEIVAVSQQEVETLRRFGFVDAKLVGTLRHVKLTTKAWKERAGLLFVGSLRTPPTPNFDSLCWFIDEVLPLIENELGWETRLTFVGYVGADVPFHRFASHPRVTWNGPADDLEPFYDTHRIAIAPTRYAAGTPYKVYEAASFGIPVVASELLCRQIGWEPEREILCASTNDAFGFASQIVRLYRSESLWYELRDAAARRLLAENGKANYIEALSEILQKQPRAARSQGRLLSSEHVKGPTLLARQANAPTLSGPSGEEVGDKELQR